jgi:hypothetical protein
MVKEKGKCKKICAKGKEKRKERKPKRISKKDSNDNKFFQFASSRGIYHAFDKPAGVFDEILQYSIMCLQCRKRLKIVIFKLTSSNHTAMHYLNIAILAEFLGSRNAQISTVWGNHKNINKNHATSCRSSPRQANKRRPSRLPATIAALLLVPAYPGGGAKGTGEWLVWPV